MDVISDNITLLRIRQLCDKRGWSIYKLAKESDIPYSSLNNIFIRNTQPTISTLEKICKGLGMSLSEFFTDDIPDDYQLRYNKLSNEELDLLEIFRSLPDCDQQILLAYAHGIAKKL